MKKTICLTVLLLLTFLSACGDGSNESEGTDVMSKATADRYDEMEIKEYQGVKLDPSVGPRDNSIKGIQNVDIESYSLNVTGLVKQEVSVTYDDVLALTSYEKLITLHCVEGWDATVLWKGVLLKDIIDPAVAEKTANTVIFHCVDGYTTSMPLAYIIENNIILAYSSNNITLPPSLGYPFIVVAEDKLGYKWARWVNEIELSDDEDYKGYWEDRGYDNEADVPENRT
ncbi:MAG TPA: molybdopterin-dependent oxidoreductase [Anaerovoracaceae bacterium]|nr:molybdopterin-dependent oxidoreductase [Anaerovoracaceae bacterium]